LFGLGRGHARADTGCWENGEYLHNL
jgi:hypothetical protein